MVLIKPIGIHEDTKQILDQLKTHPRESYDGIIQRLIKNREDILSKIRDAINSTDWSQEAKSNTLEIIKSLEAENGKETN